MQKFVQTIRVIKKKFEEKNRTIENCEGMPYFGKIEIIISEGKLVHVKAVEESIKL